MYTERYLNTLHPLQTELTFPEHTDILFDLSYMGMLDVVGDGAQSFLQGQLSCDVNAVTSERMQPGALCNLQGRILNLTDVLFWHGFHLLMPNDLLDTTQTTLARSALMSRVTLNINTNYSIYGLYHQSAKRPSFLDTALPIDKWQATHTDDYYAYAISEHLTILILNDSMKGWVLEQFSPEHTRGALAWHYLELQNDRLSIYPHTRGLFLPHRLGLHNSAYISFNKGCYKGQEIIARTHYRSKLKHGLKTYVINTTEPINAGQKIFDEQQKIEVAELIDFCPIGDYRYLIVISALFEHPIEVHFDTHLKPIRLK